MMVKLFLGGFPINADELELAKLLGPFGDISTIKIVRDRKTGKCKGYAFIEMTDQHAAESAAEALHDMEVDGRLLTVRIVEEKVEVPKKQGYVRSVNSARPANTGEIRKKRPRKSI